MIISSCYKKIRRDNIGRRKECLVVQILEKIELAIEPLPDGFVVSKHIIDAAFSGMKLKRQGICSVHHLDLLNYFVDLV